MMGLTQIRKRMWMPDGERPLDEKDVIPLKPEEVRMLSWLHKWAYENQVNIFCRRCEQPITGQNNDDPSVRHVSVSCQCREWRFQR